MKSSVVSWRVPYDLSAGWVSVSKLVSAQDKCHVWLVARLRQSAGGNHAQNQRHRFHFSSLALFSPPHCRRWIINGFEIGLKACLQLRRFVCVRCEQIAILGNILYDIEESGR